MGWGECGKRTWEVGMDCYFERHDCNEQDNCLCCFYFEN